MRYVADVHPIDLGEGTQRSAPPATALPKRSRPTESPRPFHKAALFCHLILCPNIPIFPHYFTPCFLRVSPVPSFQVILTEHHLSSSLSLSHSPFFIYTILSFISLAKFIFQLGEKVGENEEKVEKGKREQYFPLSSNDYTLKSCSIKTELMFSFQKSPNEFFCLGHPY